MKVQCVKFSSSIIKWYQVIVPPPYPSFLMTRVTCTGGIFSFAQMGH